MDAQPLFRHWDKTPESPAEWCDALYRLAKFLRGPDGCPWDREHTAAQFAEDAREEAIELVEAIASGDNTHAEEEFGDVFFVLLATAAAAEQEGRFQLSEALRRAHEKMIRRHEHVFGDTKAATPEDAVNSWLRIKEREKNA